MIKSIHLRNFQGHRETDLEFVPGVNVIAGQSDTGKSSIIRGLRWVFQNRPRGAGEAFRYKGADSKEEVSVEVRLDTGEVKRFRKGSANGYEVNGERLVAVRADVPLEASSLLDLAEHNVQAQHQPYFLLADSPGEVARKLNEVCGLDIIDSCLKNAGLLISRNKQSINEVNERIADLDTSFARYTDLDERDKAVLSLEAKEAKLSAINSRLARLDASIERVVKVSANLKDLDDFLEVEIRAQPLFEKVEKIKELSDKITKLENLITQCSRLEDRIFDADKEVKTSEKNLNAFLKEQKVCPLCGQTTVKG